MASWYKRGYALMIGWGGNAVDNESFRRQRQLLSGELSQWNLEVKSYDIPQALTAYHDLTARLLTIFTGQDLSESLVVIYYGGHGGQNEDKEAFWSCYDPGADDDEEDNFKINWSRLQELVLQAHSANVLLLIDCCHAGAMEQLSTSRNTVEAICATSFEGRTPLRDDSFTVNLEAAFRQQRVKGAAITVEYFYNSLRSAMKNKGGTVDPVHLVYSSSRRRSLELAVLPKQESEKGSVHQDGEREDVASTSPETRHRETALDSHGPADWITLSIETPTHEESRDKYSTRDVAPVRYRASSSEDEFRPRRRRQNPIRPSSIPAAGSDRGNYIYRDLVPGDIRLLKLHPASELIADLVCDILTIPFHPDAEAKVKYYTVSWVWTRNQATERLFVHDEATSSTSLSIIAIRPTLDKALRQIRSKTRFINVWVDGICLDQANRAEIQWVIPRMPEICHKAKGVFLWMGTNAADIDLTLDFIEDLNTANADKILQDPELSTKWHHLVLFMEGDCFKRRFIFQELAFAQQIVIVTRSDRLLWSRFCEAVAFADALLGRYR